jgi:hypothetical protein
LEKLKKSKKSYKKVKNCHKKAQKSQIIYEYYVLFRGSIKPLKTRRQRTEDRGQKPEVGMDGRQ